MPIRQRDLMNGDASIHDNFIRSILSNKNIAAAYFKNYLPAFISRQLNFAIVMLSKI
ncbi:hypothetical protein [Parafilimonas sp.]|uniref:hypothetical protein n=1 Tax=Parafilimonas sp. TaxID=1969739 RepID=UPI0039E70074